MNLNPVTTSYAAPTTCLADVIHYAVLPGGVTIDKSTVPTGSDGKRTLKAFAKLGKITASGKYGPYDSGASDGRETGKGLLFQVDNLDCTNVDQPVSLLIHGIVKEATLPDGAPSSTFKGHVPQISFV